MAVFLTFLLIDERNLKQQPQNLLEMLKICRETISNAYTYIVFVFQHTYIHTFAQHNIKIMKLDFFAIVHVKCSINLIQ